MKILNRFDDNIIFESSKETIKEVVLEAIKQGLALYDVNLRNADLSDANLSYANLRNADLRNADLFGTNLSGADLRNANLSGADLSGANLSGADLSCADLFGADLRNANLSDADLFGADLFGADLSCADLSGANLFGADLSCTNLSDAKNIKSFQCGEYNRISLAVKHKDYVMFKIGCFWGNTEEAINKVKEKYGTNSYYEKLIVLYTEMLMAEN